MSEMMEVFENKEFGKIRTAIIDNIPWFVGKDVAAALGYSNTTKAVRERVDNDDKITKESMGVQNRPPSITDSMGRVQYPTWINESGVYSLIFGSRLPSAKRFKRWVTSEVLPALRRSGTYSMPEAQAAQPDEDQSLELSAEDVKRIYMNRGIVIGVYRAEQEGKAGDVLDIFNRLSAKGKKLAWSLIFGGGSHL